MYRKEIVYDPESRDYKLLLDDELIGFARTYSEGETTLDQLVFELKTAQYFSVPHQEVTVERKTL